jgi:hypothetical protein
MPSDLAVTVRSHATLLSPAKRDTIRLRFATPPGDAAGRLNPASILFGVGEFDRNMRGGADGAGASVWIALASERLQQQNEFLGQHAPRPLEKPHLLMGPGVRPENSIK